MEYRVFGKTGREVSTIGLGTWQLGTRWGDPFNTAEALKILETAYTQEDYAMAFAKDSEVFEAFNTALGELIEDGAPVDVAFSAEDEDFYDLSHFRALPDAA